MRFWAIVLGLVLPGTALASDPFAEHHRPSATGVPIAYSERPIITPFRSMEVFAAVPVQRLVPAEPTFNLQTGVRHGLYNDWELGALLWPISFRNGVELAGPPSLFATRRFALSPNFEVGLSGRIAVPLVVTAWGLEASAPVLFRAGPLRIDSGLAYLYDQVAEARHSLLLPLSLTLQVVPQFRVTASAAAQGLRGPAGRAGHPELNVLAGAEVAFTIPEEAGGAFCDLVLSGALGRVATTADPSPGVFDLWSASLAARFYFFFGASTWEDDHFID